MFFRDQRRAKPEKNTFPLRKSVGKIHAQHSAKQSSGSILLAAQNLSTTLLRYKRAGSSLYYPINHSAFAASAALFALSAFFAVNPSTQMAAQFHAFHLSACTHRQMCFMVLSGSSVMLKKEVGSAVLFP